MLIIFTKNRIINRTISKITNKIIIINKITRKFKINNQIITRTNLHTITANQMHSILASSQEEGKETKTLCKYCTFLSDLSTLQSGIWSSLCINVHWTVVIEVLVTSTYGPADILAIHLPQPPKPPHPPPSAPTPQDGWKAKCFLCKFCQRQPFPSYTEIPHCIACFCTVRAWIWLHLHCAGNSLAAQQTRSSSGISCKCQCQVACFHSGPGRP